MMSPKRGGIWRNFGRILGNISFIFAYRQIVSYIIRIHIIIYIYIYIIYI